MSVKPRPQTQGETIDPRKRSCDLLAKAELRELEGFWSGLAAKPEVEILRGPETGLVMVRGRIGGGGAPFNLGEVTVSRASVRLVCGAVGHSYSLGTDRTKARLAAVVDALWQRPDMRSAIEEELLAPIERRFNAEDRRRREETAATRVDFFTMVRGED